MRKFFAGLIASLFLFATGEAYAPEGQLYVTMLDVGQGESILVETPTQNVLIDTGYISEHDKLLAELEKAGVTRFERVILTHPHVDHIGCIGYILNNYEVDEISDNGFESASPLYQLYRNSGVPISSLEAGDVLDFGGDVTFEVMSPLNKYKLINNNCIVGKLVFDNFSILLTADAEKALEEELLGRENVKADVLKASHHGSITSNIDDFLGAVNPEVILISAGKDNAYGHPHKIALHNMRAYCGNDIYCTAFNGTIKVVSDGSNFEIICENQADWLEEYTGEYVSITRL